MAEITRTIRVFGRTRQSKPTDGRRPDTFVSYTYTPDGQSFYSVKFTKDCSRRPTKPGYFLLKVDLSNVNIKVDRSDAKYKHDVLWIKDVIDFKEDTKYAEEVRAKRQKEVEELFDLDDLPF